MWPEFARNSPWPHVNCQQAKLTQTGLKRLAGNAASPNFVVRAVGFEAMHAHVAGSIWAAVLLSFKLRRGVREQLEQQEFCRGPLQVSEPLYRRSRNQ